MGATWDAGGVRARANTPHSARRGGRGLLARLVNTAIYRTLLLGGSVGGWVVGGQAGEGTKEDGRRWERGRGTWEGGSWIWVGESISRHRCYGM